MEGRRANQLSQWEWQHTEQSCGAAVWVVVVAVVVGPRHVCVCWGCLVCLVCPVVAVAGADRDG
jgi:hypothetical protein